MEPNQDLVEIKYLFEILYKLNKILYQYSKKRITKQDRVEAYETLSKRGFSNAMEFICEKARNKVENEEWTAIGARIEKECSKVLMSY